jgi:type IV pilus assembly protein PilB
MQKKVRLGDLLIEKKVVTENDIKMALGYLKEHGGKLGQALVALNIISEEKLLTALRHHFNIPSVDLRDKPIPEDLVDMLPADIAKKYVAIPVKKDEAGVKKTLFVAMLNPLDLGAIEDMQFVTGFKIKPVLCKESELLPAIERCYGAIERKDISDDSPVWVGEKDSDVSGEEEEWIEKMEGEVSSEKSKKKKELDESYYSTLKNERIVMRALVNLLTRYDIISVEEIEQEIKRVERKFTT